VVFQWVEKEEIGVAWPMLPPPSDFIRRHPSCLALVPRASCFPRRQFVVAFSYATIKRNAIVGNGYLLDIKWIIKRKASDMAAAEKHVATADFIDRYMRGRTIPKSNVAF
jgi:hypothetical protein